MEIILNFLNPNLINLTKRLMFMFAGKGHVYASNIKVLAYEWQVSQDLASYEVKDLWGVVQKCTEK